MLRVVIADDEPAARAKLARLLRAHDDIDIVAQVATGAEAADAVRAHAPDLVLLDVRMPELDGFGVVDALSRETSGSPRVVFVTAYDEYAVRAFEVRALDYVLKPYDGERLAEALDRVRHQIELEHRPAAASLRSMLGQLLERSAEVDLTPASAPQHLERLCIRSAGKIQFVRMSEVEWIEAYGNYVRLHIGDEHPLARETMRGLAAQLDPTRFGQIHRSAIVNLDRIIEINPTVSGDSIVRLDSGTRLRLSRSFRAEVERRLARR
jgi:two-component system, LytTR family, response regulator